MRESLRCRGKGLSSNRRRGDQASITSRLFHGNELGKSYSGFHKNKNKQANRIPTTLGERNKLSATNRLTCIAMYLKPPRRVPKDSGHVGTEAQHYLNPVRT